MTNDLLIGILFLVAGGGIMLFGAGVAYFILRRNHDGEKETENGEDWKVELQNFLNEDVLVVTTTMVAVLISQLVSLTSGFFYLAGLLTMVVVFKMTDDDAREGASEPSPDTDPRHIDPAGDLADAVESGDLDFSLDDDQDAADLRDLVDAAESGELGPVDPGLEAQVRIARALLDDLDDGDHE